MMRLVLALLVVAPLTARAVEPAERLADPAMEARARAISAELRCVVCQNESIDESRAELARDIRRLVRERLVAGDSDPATVQAVVARYGDFVLLRPPVKPATYALWFGPALVLTLAGLGVAIWLRRRAIRPAEPPALTPAENARLAALTGDDDR
jgi:cytochrome c-type biogenesis protein CcmH